MEDRKTKINLIDLNFKGFSVEEKRIAFILMDIMMKRLHNKNLMVADFDPKQIFFQDGFYFFEKVVPISNYYTDNKEEAVLRNILGLSNLAFCSYLPDYLLQQGLLSYDVISNHFHNFVTIFPEEDRNYYKSILVDSYQNNKLPEATVYYSDYIISTQKNNSASSQKNSLAYIKATEVGRALANQEEAAFGHSFFFLTIVTSLTILCIGLLLFFFTY